MRSYVLAPMVLLAGSVAAEPTVTFSFASDMDSNGPTFDGADTNGRIDIGRVDTDLHVDDANGPLPTLTFDSQFYANFQLTYAGSTSLPSGQFLHTYQIDGSFSFDFGSLMSVEIEQGVFTSLGDATGWGSTATIQASSIAGSTVTYDWNGDSQPGYSLFEGASTSDSTDAAFTLTNLTSFDNGDEFQGVVIDPQSGFPTLKWRSEGSYSGSAEFIPAPATVALLGMAGLATSRRRR